MVMGKPTESKIMLSDCNMIGGDNALNSTAIVAAVAARVTDHHNEVLLISFKSRYLSEKLMR
jgi:hypothetical protein